MKKFLLTLSVSLVLALSSCRPTPPANNNASGGLTPLANQEVTVTAKYVASSPPELILKIDKDPVPLKETQKINWNIVYTGLTGLTQKIHVTIGNFTDSSGKTVDLFQDGSKYDFLDLLPNKPVTPKPTGAAKAGTETEFKYEIVFTVDGKFKTTLDPRIVIDAGFYPYGPGKRD